MLRDMCNLADQTNEMPKTGENENLNEVKMTIMYMRDSERERKKLHICAQMNRQMRTHMHAHIHVR